MPERVNLPNPETVRGAVRNYGVALMGTLALGGVAPGEAYAHHDDCSRRALTPLFTSGIGAGALFVDSHGNRDNAAPFNRIKIYNIQRPELPDRCNDRQREVEVFVETRVPGNQWRRFSESKTVDGNDGAVVDRVVDTEDFTCVPGPRNRELRVASIFKYPGHQPKKFVRAPFSKYDRC